MLVPGCVCALVPRLHTRTHLVLVLHAAEAKKPTNTGRLAALCCDNSRVLVRGLPNQPLELAFLAGQNAAILCPEEGAKLLEPSPDPLTLVVPDGSWRQASKMPRREPMLRNLPRVGLPALPARAPELRRETKDGGLATFVAVARALGILEGAACEQALLEFYDVLAERILLARQGQPTPKGPLTREGGEQ